MTHDDFDRGIRRYYAEQTLSSEVLARLGAMGRAEEESATLLKKEKLQRRYFALVASLVVAIVIGGQFSSVFRAPEGDLLLRVAQEVALNHNKQLANEFVFDHSSELAATMDKLDFELALPVYFKEANIKLLGARYCSIQGQIAAQLKLLDQEGQPMTLYVTRLNDPLASLHNRNQLREDLLIRNWHEDELFFSLARQQ